MFVTGLEPTTTQSEPTTTLFRPVWLNERVFVYELSGHMPVFKLSRSDSYLNDDTYFSAREDVNCYYSGN